MADRNAAVLETAKQAASILVAPDSSNEQRRRAYETFEEVKGCRDQLMDVGLKLAVSRDPFLQYAGLQLVEHGVCTHWKPQVCAKLVPQICHYWKEVLVREFSTSLVQVQLSRLLVELVKRLWPQYWPTFTNDVLASLQQGRSQLKVALLTLQGLGDELLGAEQKVKDKERKRQLMSALRTEFEQWNDLLRHILQTADDSDVLRTALEALLAYMGWMPVESLFSGSEGSSILDCLLTVLTVEDLRMQGAECLHILLSRRKDAFLNDSDLSKRTISWFFGNFPHLVAIINRSAAVLNSHVAEDLDGKDEYLFLRQMSQVTMEMGTTLLLSYKKTESEPVAPVNFASYLELMLFWLSCDSQIISYEVCEFWKLLIHNFYYEVELMKCIPYLLNNFHKTLSKVTSKLIEYDFEGSTVEASAYNSVYKSAHVHLVKLLMTVLPEHCKAHLRQWTETLVEASRQLNLNQAMPSSVSDLTVQSVSCGDEVDSTHPLVQEWSAYLSFLETWAKTPQTDGDQKIKDGLLMLQALIQAECKHGLVMWSVIKSWCTLHSFAIHDASVLRAVLSKFTQYVVYCPSGEQMHWFSKATLQVRRTALSGLSRLCSSFPKQLSQHGLAEDLLKFYSDLLNERKIRVGEKSGFVESISFLSNCLLDDAKWQSNLQSVLGMERAVLDEVQQHSAHSGMEAFVRYLHLDKECTDPLYSEGKLRQARLSSAVGCYTAILKGYAHINKLFQGDQELAPLLTQRASFLFKNIAADLTVLILKFIRCLYGVWSPSAVPYLAPSLKTLSKSYHCFEIETIMGSAVLHPDLKESGEHVDYVRLWLSGLYENCVMFIENVMCSCPEFFSTLSAPLQVAQCVFVEGMDPFRQKTALRHLLLSSVCVCPPRCYGNLAPSIAWAFRVVQKTLNERWLKVASTKEQSRSGEEAQSHSNDEEIFFHHLTVFLGKEYFKCLDAALLKQMAVDPPEQMAPSNSIEMADAVAGHCVDVSAQMSALGLGGVKLSELASFLWDNDYAGMLLEWSYAPLLWLDSSQVIRAAKLASGVYSKYLTSDALDPSVTCHLFRQLLQSVSTYGEEVAKITVNLSYFVYATNVGCAPVREELLQANCTSPGELRVLDNHIASNQMKQARELFKKIAARIHKVPLSEQYKKKDNFIYKLPEMKPKRKRATATSLLDLEPQDSEEHDILGLASLFGD